MEKRKPIILIHGLWNKSDIFSSITLKLDHKKIEYFAPTLKHAYGMTSIVELTKVLNELILKKYGSEEEIDILGFSMGGIIARYWIKKFDGYIAIYWPIQNEVDLRSIKAKYSLALPRCTANKTLEFYIWDESPLENDYEGIPTPKNNFLLEPKDISLIFAPCLSIDKRFIRLGYGGGYFDKLRGNILWNKIQCVGVLTANCVSNDFLVKSKLDIPLSGYITDKEILI